MQNLEEWRVNEKMCNSQCAKEWRQKFTERGGADEFQPNRTGWSCFRSRRSSRQKVSSPVVGLRNALTKSVANEISRLFAQNFAQHDGQVWQIAALRLSN